MQVERQLAASNPTSQNQTRRRTWASAKAHDGKSWLSAARESHAEHQDGIHKLLGARIPAQSAAISIDASRMPSTVVATSIPWIGAPRCLRNTGLASCANASWGAEFMLRKMALSTCSAMHRERGEG